MCTEQNSPNMYVPPQSSATSFSACVPSSVNNPAQEASLMLPFPSLFLAKRKQKNMKCSPYLQSKAYICLES